MTADITGKLCPQDTQNSSFETRALRLAAYALGAAAFSISAYAGWNRANNFIASFSWALVGCAAVTIAITAPAQIRLAVARNERKGAIALGVAYGLALLMSVTVALGSAAGGRVSAVDTANAATDTRARNQAAYEAATRELATLAPSRTAGEVRAIIAPLTAKIRDKDCGGWLPDKATRAACASRHALQIELARADRRTELLSQQANASAALNDAPVAPLANSDAVALVGYLAAVGISTDADTVAKWLVLLAVGLLDAVPGLVLAAVNRQTGKVDSVNAPDGLQHSESAPGPMPFAGFEGFDPIVTRLQAGALQGRQRDLAAMFGLPVTSFRRRLESLPNVKMTAGRDSSRLELVA